MKIRLNVEACRAASWTCKGFQSSLWNVLPVGQVLIHDTRQSARIAMKTVQQLQSAKTKPFVLIRKHRTCADEEAVHDGGLCFNSESVSSVRQCQLR